jgi:phosphoadenosine phosphosulfate reductase
MRRTLELINEACSTHGPGYLAFSGGTDSTVLLDLVYRCTAHRPPLVYVDAQNDYPGTLEHVQACAARYQATIYPIRATKPLHRQWTRTGWPMLGKLRGREWMQRHRGLGIRIDCSSCCSAMKTEPARQFAKSLGMRLAITGQRGSEDDCLRGTRSWRDGALALNKAAGLWTANPLDGWTATMVNRYSRAHDLPRHPARDRGAVTIGCIWCGGGAQYSASCYRVLRRTAPDLWRRFIVDLRGGEIILAVKHLAPIPTVRQALQRLGGLAAVADTRPWIFDFLETPPRTNYDR